MQVLQMRQRHIEQAKEFLELYVCDTTRIVEINIKDDDPSGNFDAKIRLVDR